MNDEITAIIYCQNFLDIKLNSVELLLHQSLVILFEVANVIFIYIAFTINRAWYWYVYSTLTINKCIFSILQPHNHPFLPQECVTVRLKTNARFSPNLPTSNQQLAANAKRRLSYDFNRNIMT